MLKKRLYASMIMPIILATLLIVSSVGSLSISSIVVSSTGTIQSSQFAKSGSAKDIQTAINFVAAQGGGTVHIPAGTFNFYEAGDTWESVYVPIGVNIIGASPSGYDSMGIPTSWNTVLKQGLKVSGESYTWFVLGQEYAGQYWSWADSKDPVGPVDDSRWDKPIRFANIMLDGWRSQPGEELSGVMFTGIKIFGVINFRVDHCNFKNLGGGGISIPPWHRTNDHCCGVIDHNKIWNTNGISNNGNMYLGNVFYGIQIHRDSNINTIDYEPLSNLLGKYTSNTVYIENNYFSKWRHSIASSNGAWYVARYNLFENDFDQVTTDMHGERFGDGYAGARGGELYENTFLNCTYHGDDNNPSKLRGVFCVRGGSGVFFNNYADNTYLRVFVDEYDYAFNEVWKMKDWFFWSAKGIIPEIAVIANHNPFTYNSSNNNHLDWARQAGSPSDANYPNPDPSWTISNYKPYAYPHPLTLGLEP